MKVKTVIEIDYDELEGIVNRHYGIQDKQGGEGYSFVATQECGNDCSFTFHVPSAKPLDKWEQEDIQKLRETGHSPWRNSVIIQDLVNNGVLAPGEYLVKVSW